LTGTPLVDPAARIDLDRRSGDGRLRSSTSGQPPAGSAEKAARGSGIAGEARSRVSGHESRRDLVLDAELDAANSTSASTRAEGRRRQRPTRRGGGRRGCVSGELLPAVLSRRTSTSGTASLLTSCSFSRSKPRRRGGDVGGVRLRRRRLGFGGRPAALGYAGRAKGVRKGVAQQGGAF
jgi:hypothetical protein